jgi:hypothetical protein
MARFPRIDSPCPYKSQAAAFMDGDMCRLCQRQVFDLSAMEEDARAAFLRGCSEEICVSYRLPVRPALAAAALAAALAAMPAAAQEAPAAPTAPDVVQAEEQIDYVYEIPIVLGGIKDPARAPLIEDPADLALTEAPVTYEDEAPPAAPAAKPGA